MNAKTYLKIFTNITYNLKDKKMETKG